MEHLKKFLAKRWKKVLESVQINFLSSFFFTLIKFNKHYVRK